LASSATEKAHSETLGEFRYVKSLIGNVIFVSVVGSAVVRAIAKRFAFRKSATAKDMHLFSLFTPEWTSIFVGNVDISLDNNRPFGVAANLHDTRFGGCWHSDGSSMVLIKFLVLVTKADDNESQTGSLPYV